ncbi:MAG TPA: hypothetical protein VKZ49_04505, partial [Polyangiaceae bacterium]|nr:hypothetical protein [Polyangiaceae bacterium]
QANTWLVGGLIALVALFALWVPAARFANTALGAWLFISTFFIVHLAVGSMWHNAIVAAIVFLASLVPSESLQRGGGHRGYGPMQPTT